MLQRAGADRKPTDGELGSGICVGGGRPACSGIGASHWLTAKLMKYLGNFSVGP